jgi:drug/metabolite transporter (DMT)-like permease
MALLGIIEFGGGLMLYLAGAKRVPAAEAALMSLLETVLAPLWAWLVIAENPGERAILGGAIVLAAVAAPLLADLRPAAASN